MEEIKEYVCMYVFDNDTSKSRLRKRRRGLGGGVSMTSTSKNLEGGKERKEGREEMTVQ